MRWRLILEEYNPELTYIQGSKNIAADALIRLDIVDINNPIKHNMSSLAEKFFFRKRGSSISSWLWNYYAIILFSIFMGQIRNIL